MAMRLCVECATIWAIPDGLPLICPRCQQPLTMHDDDDGSKSWTEVVSEAAHGPAPRVRRRWEVG